jgi:hypothetical protein
MPEWSERPCNARRRSWLPVVPGSAGPKTLLDGLPTTDLTPSSRRVAWLFVVEALALGSVARQCRWPDFSSAGPM